MEENSHSILHRIVGCMHDCSANYRASIRQINDGKKKRAHIPGVSGAVFCLPDFYKCKKNLRLKDKQCYIS